MGLRNADPLTPTTTVCSALPSDEDGTTNTRLRLEGICIYGQWEQWPYGGVRVAVIQGPLRTELLLIASVKTVATENHDFGVVPGPPYLPTI